jgi:hypothetical protein
MFVLPLLMMLAGCMTADFADGVTGFSGAVTKVDNSETALARADQQAQMDQWSGMAGRAPRTAISADLVKCNATPYQAGDCRLTATIVDSRGVKEKRPAPVTVVKSSLPALKAYSAQLAAVVADQSCATLKSNAKSLAGEVSDLAKLAGDAGFASRADPISTIAATVGCWQINRAQLQILKTATQTADPIVQKLVPVIADKNAQMAADVGVGCFRREALELIADGWANLDLLPDTHWQEIAARNRATLQGFEDRGWLADATQAEVGRALDWPWPLYDLDLSMKPADLDAMVEQRARHYPG